jgi:uncharacterized protein YyaL (SSP411 family)
MVEKTLTEMRLGGIYDHIGFGFHRYSTDPEWLVPHFEKMLYDQALLAIAYIETYQATGRDEFAQTAREIFTYILRDMTSPEGGFYSAEDADSEGEEGKFYVWIQEEIGEALGESNGDIFCEAYNVKEGGNFAGEFPGGNILHLKKTPESIASELDIEVSDLYKRLEEDRFKLLGIRSKRVHPLKDDKIIASWNGLMISALARGYQVFGEEEYNTAASHAVEFILSSMTDDKDRLLRRYRDGIASLPAHLNDYAFMVQALLDLYEASFDIRYLKEAIRLNSLMETLFWDDQNGGFFFTANDGEALPLRTKQIYDGAMPSGNSIATLNLLRLERFTAKVEYGEKAGKIMEFFAGQVNKYPASFTQFLTAVDFSRGPTYEVVFAGRAGTESTTTMVKALRKEFIPNKVVLFRPTDEEIPEITKIASYTHQQTDIDGKTSVYVCKSFACQMPTSDTATMLASFGFGED